MSEYSRRIQSCCNFEQAKEILITFVLTVKAAEELEHQCNNSGNTDQSECLITIVSLHMKYEQLSKMYDGVYIQVTK